MTTLAVTGHMDLTEESVPLVRAAPREALEPYREDLTGVSCIAAGADTLFAEEVIAVGGRLVVVIPSRDYRDSKVKPGHAPVFDRLVAVWNGEPPSGRGGGTSDVVGARRGGMPVDVVRPDGAARRA
ncbi:hypothetical protein [Streptomyces sp. NPDC093109]|uniref:hypothetical protein n=1 Tax=Streptomyces sp. NPDC093109 TaxID=3154977 RepID=UPI00344DD5F6